MRTYGNVQMPTEYQKTVPLQFRTHVIIHNYANVWTINQSKSLHGFREVASLDSINGSSNQTRPEKTADISAYGTRVSMGLTDRRKRPKI